MLYLSLLIVVVVVRGEIVVVVVVVALAVLLRLLLVVGGAGGDLLMVEVVEGVVVASFHGRYRVRSWVKERERRPDGGGWVGERRGVKR